MLFSKINTTFAVRRISVNNEQSQKCFKKKDQRRGESTQHILCSHRCSSQRLVPFFNSNQFVMRRTNAKRGKSTPTPIHPNYDEDPVGVIPPRECEAIAREFWGISEVHHLTDPEAIKQKIMWRFIVSLCHQHFHPTEWNGMKHLIGQYEAANRFIEAERQRKRKIEAAICKRSGLS